MSEMGAADFKAHCLAVMEKVRRTRRAVVITKRGVPVARLVPVDPPREKDAFGCMADKTVSIGDLDKPLWTEAHWRDFERQRKEQWRAWEREWRASGTIAGKRTVGLPPGLGRNRASRSRARRCR